jgi:alkylation response protein AidB-like acyl-CoA dehydrogenase
MLLGQSPGSKVHAHNPMYKLPPVPFLAFMTTIPSVAAARGLIRLFAERLGSRKRFGEEQPQFEKSSMQVRMAKADMMAHAAELSLRDMARQMMDSVRSGRVLEPQDRVRLLTQCAHTSSLAYEVGQLVQRGAGASVHLTSNPIGRLMRDLNVASSHQLHEFDEMAEQHGRALFGLPITSKFI